MFGIDLEEDAGKLDSSCRYAINLAREFGEYLKAEGKDTFTFGELREFDKSRFKESLDDAVMNGVGITSVSSDKEQIIVNNIPHKEFMSIDNGEPDLGEEDLPPKSQFPQYECTKKIEALKIRRVEFDYPLCRLWVSPVGMDKIDINIQIGCVDVGKEYIKRFSPDTGGYYIKDENGSESYCSGDVFEFLFSVV
jgi:hypothetical protein